MDNSRRNTLWIIIVLIIFLGVAVFVWYYYFRDQFSGQNVDEPVTGELTVAPPGGDVTDREPDGQDDIPTRVEDDEDDVKDPNDTGDTNDEDTTPKPPSPTTGPTTIAPPVITLPPVQETTQVGTGGSPTLQGSSLIEQLDPFSPTRRSTDMNVAFVEKLDCNARYGDVEFCNKENAVVADIIQRYDELKEMDVGELFAEINDMVFDLYSPIPEDGNSPLATNAIEAGGSMIDIYRHICFDRDTAEAGGVPLPPSQSGHYCTLDPEVSSKRTCAENVAIVKQCTTAIDTYGPYDDSEIEALKGKYFDNLGIPRSL